MPGRITPEAYDVLLQDPDDAEHPIGVMLARRRDRPLVLEELFEPTELGAISPPRPVPVIWDDWTGGAGLAKRIQGVRSGYRMASNACTRFGRAVTPAGALHEYDLAAVGYAPARINGFAAFGGVVIALTADHRPLILRLGGAGVVESAGTLAPGFRCEDAAVFDGALWVSGGGGQSIARYDGGSWQQAGAGVVVRSRIAPVTWTRAGVPRRRLVATNENGTQIAYTTGDDPHNPAHWSAWIDVESAYGLQRLLAGPRHVYGVGPGGVYDLLETGETPSLTGDAWSKNYDPSNGAAAVLYDGALYVAQATGTYRLGLDGRLVDVLEDVSIGHLQPAEIPVGGRPRVLLVIDGWLAEITHTAATATSQLWYGMRRERTGAAVPWPLVWHGSECDLVNQDVTAAAVVSPVGAPRRLLLGTTDLQTGATRLWWQSLPKYGSPLADYAFGSAPDRMDYARTWRITFTDEDLGDPASRKNPLWWDVLGDHLGGPNTLTVSAMGRSDLPVVQGTATTGDDRFGAAGVADKTITVTVDGANSETVPAVLEAVKGSWVVTVDESATIALPLVFGQGVSLLNGAEDPQDAEITFARLVNLTRHTHVSAVRWDGAPVLLRVEQGVRKRWQESPDGQGWLNGAVLLVTTLARPLIHDIGDPMDLGLRHDAG